MVKEEESFSSFFLLPNSLTPSMSHPSFALDNPSTSQDDLAQQTSSTRRRQVRRTSSSTPSSSWQARLGVDSTVSKINLSAFFLHSAASIVSHSTQSISAIIHKGGLSLEILLISFSLPCLLSSDLSRLPQRSSTFPYCSTRSERKRRFPQRYSRLCRWLVDVLRIQSLLWTALRLTNSLNSCSLSSFRIAQSGFDSHLGLSSRPLWNQSRGLFVIHSDSFWIAIIHPCCSCLARSSLR